MKIPVCFDTERGLADAAEKRYKHLILNARQFTADPNQNKKTSRKPYQNSINCFDADLLLVDAAKQAHQLAFAKITIVLF